MCLETIRYYERRDLLPEPPRNESGYRQYSQDDITRTQFIKRAQTLGIKEYYARFNLESITNRTGNTSNVSNVDVITPPITTVARGR